MANRDELRRIADELDGPDWPEERETLPGIPSNVPREAKTVATVMLSLPLRHRAPVVVSLALIAGLLAGWAIARGWHW